MVRTVFLALCLTAPVALRAGGPEDARLSAEQSFGAAPPFAPLRLVAAKAPPRAKLPEIHSDLDFGGVTWPASLTPEDRVAFQVALNISASFEGDEAWSTISNNFDGQGLSLGLLNQCLGQGSLQPLLIGMRERSPEKLASLLGAEHLQSLLGMLRRWQGEAASRKVLVPLSRFDLPTEAGDSMSVSANQGSVDWAVANLYSDGGKTFDPVWKAELMALAGCPEYVSLQIEAALYLHEKALGLQEQAGVRELRAYLMLYDVAVQNGGIYPQDWVDYGDYLKAQPGATSTQKLQKLLELRLRHVRPQYVADVRSRKSAIITGKGKVHGRQRDLPAEYAYDPFWAYR